MKVILGIGNIGAQYNQTRHNIGFDVVDALAKKHGASFQSAKWDCTTASIGTGDDRILLLKPTTYVNRSGRAAQGVMAFYKVKPEDLLVVVDDIHLPVATLRLRGNGSDGGHNGLKDLIACIGKGFPRLRFGVGSPQFNQVDYVLGRFPPEEQDDVGKGIAKAVLCCERWAQDSLDAAMRLNGPINPPPKRQKKTPPPAAGDATTVDDANNDSAAPSSTATETDTKPPHPH